MAVAVGALAAQAVPPAPARSGPGFLDPSAAGAGSIPGFPINDTVAAKRVAGAGAGIVRLYAFWQRLAPNPPSNPNDYEWSELDPQVEAAVARGLDVMLTLRSAPDWAQKHNCGTDPTLYNRGTCRPNPAAFHDFARDLANHYKAPQFGGHVKYWGMWNEPNLPSFLSPQYVKKNGKRTLVSADIYRTLLNRGARAVHQVDPDNRVIGGETAPFGHPKSPSPLLFLRKLLCVTNSGQKTCSKSRVEADIWATHPYTSGNPWHHAFGKDDVSFGDLGQWKNTSRARPTRAAF